MKITLNGESQNIAENLTVEALLQSLNYANSNLAIAINGDFVARSAYQATQIQSEDDIEIVAPMQGG